MKSLLLLALLMSTAHSQNPTDLCAALDHLTLPHTTITTEHITTGAFQPPTAKPLTSLPPFCRVSLVSSPEPNSSIRIELWLPDTNWNHRLLGTGNGGGGGNLSFGELAKGLTHHFATANTDLGTFPNANGLPHPLVAATDFGHRATHEMTIASKAVIAAYYKEPLQRAYFSGCSTGGQQALSEAQRYPDDYDGILAGAPANNRTHLHSEFLWHYQAAHTAPNNKSFLPPDLIKFISAEAIKACAGKDGGAPTDTFLTDPRACKFTPDQLPRCTAGPANNCITPEQLTTLKTIYAGLSNPTTGEQIYPSIPFGSEASGGGLEYHEAGLAHDHFYPFTWALGVAFNPLTFSFDTDETAVDKILAPLVNANNPDLAPFQKHGGKLLMYTGTADPLVPYPDTLHYYERVIHAQHDSLADTQSFFRYYLIPGVAHCGGGPGLNSFGNLLTTLQTWVEQGTAPNELPASNSTTHIGRNLCPYPLFPTYTKGDPALASSFTCQAHPRDISKPPAERYLK